MNPNENFRRFYKTISVTFCIIFSIVGLTFLFFHGKVLIFFNTLSRYMGMAPSPIEGIDFYLALAVAYMYLVSLISFLMFRHPENPSFPLLLANGKAASSFLSLILFAAHKPYLIFLVNFVVDGLIGLIAWVFYVRLKRIG